ncbi:MAG: EamA family transporter [Candidatus Altiarchaeota archaeon]|nr:EamA family transporter [Candidatus Altiarchaeota archaeon]
MNAEPWAVAMIIVASLLGAFGSIYLKKGSGRLEFSPRKLAGNRDLIYGFLLYGLSSLFFIVGLKGGELSVLYPLVALSYVWICILSVRILKESMGFWKWLGVVLIVAGVGLIGMGGAV